ncbi:BTB/POZ and MATH domain-containing protein 2-like [Triticum urartu]|uniref:BTB/POZ and MATH domain-containing protein 2-like n=1 Tax=Triticum urartu TaxID=4572 RepID=UPI0020439370|nr:BTB/POZ and MATH domain-containing protein 2-like [Triticum urartu]
MGVGPSVADGGDTTAVTGSISEVPKVSGTHEFTIREYSRTKGMGVGKSILSQYFSVDGRRWYIRFYPDGYSTADGAWVAFYAQTLYKPQFRPVRAEFTFQLLGPNGDVRHTRRSDRACKYDTFCNSWGIRRYITREQLESAALGAIHADSITVRCTVTIHLARRRSLAINRPGLVQMPPPPPSNHGENALRFLAGGKAPFDVRFDVDGEIFEAHRMVVAAQSAWFESLLYGHGREAGKDVLEVGGGIVTPEAFRGVLHFIYTDELPPEAAKGRGSYDLTLRLFEAADYYLIERLKLMCACRLGDFIKDSTVDALMEMAEDYSCKDLAQACRNFAARRGLSLAAIKRRLLSSGAAPATRRIMDVPAPSTSG